ncbi:MAG TPA: sigma-70 family RNA polymerase sigma factor [Gemmataceae bacterium]|nr:sigma-70 family RNA polymerase sigma factor [Gemmataceae bacterium]
MSNDPENATRASLLVRLRTGPNDQAAWNAFVRRYVPLILRWCRDWKLQEVDAEDVTQTVLLKLSEKMRTFDYDPSRSFRAYLKTLTRYAWCDFLEARGKRPDVGSGDSRMLSQLQTAEARDDLLRRLDEEFDRELLEEAMARVRARVEPHTWDAFRLTALEGVGAAEAAERLGLRTAVVIKAKSKVRLMLAEEVRGRDAA